VDCGGSREGGRIWDGEEGEKRRNVGRASWERKQSAVAMRQKFPPLFFNSHKYVMIVSF